MTNAIHATRLSRRQLKWAVSALVIATALRLFGCADEKTSGPCIGDRPELRDPVWRVDTLVVGSPFDSDPRPYVYYWVDSFEVNGVWQASETEAYAVGSVWDSNTYRGVIWRFDGTDWTTSYSARKGSVLQDVHGTSPTDVWVVGVLIRPTRFATGVYALHWDGGQWTEALVDSFAQGLYCVWADKGDVYAGGANSTILHWDGLAWNHESAPSQPGGMSDIWGVSDGCSRTTQDLYIAAAPGFKLLRRTDAGWMDESAPGPTSSWSAGYIGVWGQSPDGLYLLNEDGNSGPTPFGTVQRRVDTTWSRTGVWQVPGKFVAIRGDEWGTVYVIKWGGVYRLVGDSVVAYNGFPLSRPVDAWVRGLTLMVVGTSGNAGVVVTGSF